MLLLPKIPNFDLEERRKKYRHGLEIARDMLSVASVKVKKTRIMYQANLSYRLMEKYLKRLLENRLIECIDNSFYVITGKGKEFLQMYEDYLVRRRRIHEDIKGAHKDRLLLENMCFNNDWNFELAAGKKGVLVDIKEE